MNLNIVEHVDLFDRMTADWQLLHSRRVEKQTSRWISLFDEYVAVQQKHRDRGEWYAGPKDLLSIIGRQRRETFHNAVLAWLLDPAAPHGFGTEFLVRFLEYCFLDRRFDSTALTATTTECEVARDNSRADILVWNAGFTVVIEVKVDSVERKQQCDDLYRDFRQETGASFVFLTPTGREPATATNDAQMAFQTLSFEVVRQILSELCDAHQQRCPPAPGRYSTLCYLQTLEVEFP